MRLWSLHPHYLDKKGLCGLWAEACIAQKVLIQGKYKKCPKCFGRKTSLAFTHIKFHYKEIICSKCKGVGKIKTPYYNHPQLERFKGKSIYYMGSYLLIIYLEANKRGYKFNKNKISKYVIGHKHNDIKLTVTKGQLKFEFKHLQNKLWKRCPQIADYNSSIIKHIDMKIEPHPLFKVIEGEKENWEKGGEK